MRTTYLVQTSATTTVLIAFLVADLAARLLSLYPGSETLWYAQLEVLRPLGLLRASHPALDYLFGSNILPIGCGLLIVAWTACKLRQRLVVAILANGSALIVGAIAYLWSRGTHLYETTSLDWVFIDPRPDYILVVFLCVVSVSSFLASHISFIRAIKSS